MTIRTLLVLLLLASVPALPQEKKKKRTSDPGPQPRVVTPGNAGTAPSDAVLLFNGKDMTGWKTRQGEPAKCDAIRNEMVCKTGVGDVITDETFQDAQIHLEFAIPLMAAEKGQMRGNSGVYVHSCYEVQILDSYQNPTYANGSIGAVYGISTPMVNASRPPEQWQSYDMVFRAPRCDAAGTVTEPGRLTVLLNNVLVQDHVAITKKGPGCQAESICQRGPLRLQDHSGFPGAPTTVMKFRNLWLRKLE